MFNVTVKKTEGKMVMTVDAAGFHQYLESIGAPRDSYGRFTGLPYQRTGNWVDTDYTTVTANLLTRKMPVDLPSGGVEYKSMPIAVNLSEYYSRPPTLEVVKALVASIGVKARELIDHYRPIDVAIRIVGKKPEAATPAF